MVAISRALAEGRVEKAVDIANEIEEEALLLRALPGIRDALIGMIEAGNYNKAIVIASGIGVHDYRGVTDYVLREVLDEFNRALMEIIQDHSLARAIEIATSVCGGIPDPFISLFQALMRTGQTNEAIMVATRIKDRKECKKAEDDCDDLLIDWITHGNADHAHRVIGDIDDEVLKEETIANIFARLIGKRDFDEAFELAENLEDENLMKETAEAFVRNGGYNNVTRAIEIVNGIEDEETRDDAKWSITEKFIENNIEKKTELAFQMERLAGSIVDQELKDQALSMIAEYFIELGDLEEGVSILNEIQDEGEVDDLTTQVMKKLVVKVDGVSEEEMPDVIDAIAIASSIQNDTLEKSNGLGGMFEILKNQVAAGCDYLIGSALEVSYLFSEEDNRGETFYYLIRAIIDSNSVDRAIEVVDRNFDEAVRNAVRERLIEEFIEDFRNGRAGVEDEVRALRFGTQMRDKILAAITNN
jgi:hypothetical protein